MGRMHSRGKRKRKNTDEIMEECVADASCCRDGETSADAMREEKDYIDITPEGLDRDDTEEENEDDYDVQNRKRHKSESEKHKEHLQRLKVKDPEFFEFLKDHDKELLEFSDKDGMDVEDGLHDTQKFQYDEIENMERRDSKRQRVLTTSIVDSWFRAIKERKSVSALFSIVKAFRSACHYGDSGADDSAANLSIMTSDVFNRVMFSVLSEMDSLFRNLLQLPSSGGDSNTVLELKESREWKKYGHFIKTYLSNALYILNQMTDHQMISFTIRRLRPSVIFLAAFPSLLRKFLKAALHFWGSGEGALSVVSFLFIREMGICLGPDCLDTCMKGIYKAYIKVCKFVNASSFQHIDFLSNCVIELYGVDLASAYQHSFVFVRQLALVLRNAITMQTKDAYTQVYNWKFMNCLDLWVKLLCKYSERDDLRPLTYPISQIISGVARLVPSARYFPLHLHCVRMLNRLAAATKMFIPVTSFLVDMLEFKELYKSPTGGLGKSIDFMSSLKVPKQLLKTRAFQEECIFSVILQLSEHLVLCSYSVTFPELAFIPLVRLRKFSKRTKVDRFRRQIKELIYQIVRNVEFVGIKRSEIAFSPKDFGSIESFLQAEKEAGLSPLAQYSAVLHQKAAQQKVALHGSSVEVSDERDTHLKRISIPHNDEELDDDPEEAKQIFSKDWRPELKANKKELSDSHYSGKSVSSPTEDNEEDVLETLELSSDEDVNVYEYDDANVVKNYETGGRVLGDKSVVGKHTKKRKSKWTGEKSHRKGEKPGKKNTHFKKRRTA